MANSLPTELEPCLARVEKLDSLGFSTFYEVVYYDTETFRWCHYAGSDTFNNGEVVKSWVRCCDIPEVN